MIIKKNWAWYVGALALAASNITFAMSQDHSEIKSNITNTQTTAYINLGENCSVAMIDLKTDQLLDTIQINADKKGCILESVVTPKRDQLYAIKANEHGVDQYVQVFDTKSHTLLNSILVSSSPIRMPLSNIVMQPNGSHVYVSSYGSSGNDTVWDIDTSTQKTSMIRMGKRSTPGQMVISPDGNKLYVATRGENSISMVDTVSDTVVGVIEHVDASKMALSRDGKILYTSWADKLLAFDTATNNKLWEKQLPFEIGLSFTISPDNQTLYASSLNRAGFFAVNLDTLAVNQLLSTTNSLWGNAVTDDGKMIYVADYDGGEMLAMNAVTGEIRARVSSLGKPETLYLY